MPPCSRPSVKMGDKTGDDDLTFKYVEIVKVNNKLKEKKIPEKKKKELVELLIGHVKTMFDNHKKKAKQITNKRPIKGIRERFVGKQEDLEIIFPVKGLIIVYEPYLILILIWDFIKLEFQWNVKIN